MSLEGSSLSIAHSMTGAKAALRSCRGRTARQSTHSRARWFSCQAACMRLGVGRASAEMNLDDRKPLTPGLDHANVWVRKE
jgi:hypothetical protein